jgi:hypothetical protein
MKKSGTTSGVTGDQSRAAPRGVCTSLGREVSRNPGVSHSETFFEISGIKKVK